LFSGFNFGGGMGRELPAQSFVEGRAVNIEGGIYEVGVGVGSI
jgi:hypothetical protein